MTSRGHRHGGGYILVWFALMMVVLLAIVGFSFDLGDRFAEDEKAQRAADAAALAGVVHRVPGSTNNKACEVAFATAAQNGYRNGAGGETTCTPATSPATVRVDFPLGNQLRVTVNTVARSTFAAVIGVGDSTFSRSATAAYDSTVPIGSPVNVLGNEPLAPGENSWLPPGADALQNASMWLDIHGVRTHTHQGDQFSANECGTRNGSGAKPDNCLRSGTDQVNRDYENDGKFGRIFVVRVPVGYSGGPIDVQAYDAAFTHVGADCRHGGGFVPAPDGLDRWYTALENLWRWVDTHPGDVQEGSQADFLARYAPTPSGSAVGSKFCAGDDALGSDINALAENCTSNCTTGGGGPGGYTPSAGDGSPLPILTPRDSARTGTQLAALYAGAGLKGFPVTQFDLLQHEGEGGRPVTPGDLSDNNLIGNPEKFGYFEYPPGGCQVYCIDNLRDSWRFNLHDTVEPSGTQGTHTFQTTFMKWKSIGTIPSPVAGTDYYIRVRTNVNGDGARSGAGANRFALRAGDLGGNDQGISLFAFKNLTVAANVTGIDGTGSGAEFFLARIQPSNVDRTLTFTFFDPGDLTGCARSDNYPMPITFLGDLTPATLRYFTTNGVDHPTSCDIPRYDALQGSFAIGRNSSTTGGTFRLLDDVLGILPCRIWRPNGGRVSNGSTVAPPYPMIRPAPQSCDTSRLSPEYRISTETNSKLLRAEIRLPNASDPNGYRCDTADVFDCWLKVRFEFDPTYTSNQIQIYNLYPPGTPWPVPAGVVKVPVTFPYCGLEPNGSYGPRSVAPSPTGPYECEVRPSDTTTWTAEISGSPARLVDN